MIKPKLAAVHWIDGVTYLGISASSLQQNTAVELREYTLIPTERISQSEESSSNLLKMIYNERKEKGILVNEKIRIPEGGIIKTLE